MNVANLMQFVTYIDLRALYTYMFQVKETPFNYLWVQKCRKDSTFIPFGVPALFQHPPAHIFDL